MIKKEQKTGQMSFLMPSLAEQLDKSHGLYQLAKEINWSYFDEEFGKHYRADFGRPAKPIRLMVSLLILKHLRNLSDESVVEQWSENCYYQYFSGQNEFTPKQPCSATELVMFRNRIGSDGMEKIFKESIRINGVDGKENEIVGDTTVQEKNITYPTDSKLHIKIIEKCWKIIENEDLDIRQSYKRIVPKLRYQQRGRNHPKHAVKARRADKKIKTIAGRLVREIERNLPAQNIYNEDILIFKKVLLQKKADSNKIYSLHEPNVNCISKGKDHKKYEFGCKVSILRTKNTGVLVGAKSFEKNVYDGKTLESSLEQYRNLTGQEAKRGYFDLGYRGVKKIGETEIITPDARKKSMTAYQRMKHKKSMKRRSAIEPIIGHLKQDHRVGRNFLKGTAGDEMNILLAAAAFNFKRFIRLRAPAFFNQIFNTFWKIIEILFESFYIKNSPKMTF
jgi:IS5 family transposase